jgi:AcrR family transcriptional regulator
MSGTADRPLRADARRNRERLLEVAEAVFTAKGTAASTEEIAREAGVGVGTVFRHFPTKEALIAEVYSRLLRRLGETAREMADREDAGAAFYEVILLIIGRAQAKNAFADALTEAGVEIPQPAAGADGRSLLADTLDGLMRRAQAAGAVRPDMGPEELRAWLVGVCRALEQVRDQEVRDHVIAIFYAGLTSPIPA